MPGTQELERLVVRLVGEGSQYQKFIKDAVSRTEKASKEIEGVIKGTQGAQARAMEEAARITDSVATPTERYAREVKQLDRYLKEGTITQKTYARSVRRVAKELGVGMYAAEAFGRKLQAVGQRMRGFGMMATFGITMPVAGMVAGFGSFDDKMTKSTAIMSDVTADVRKEMEATARSISDNSVTAAGDLAEAYFFLASAGLSAKQSIAALSTVEKFAVAGAFDMAAATDLLTDAQSALGMTSKDDQRNKTGMLRVSDVLVKANTLANASVQQFSESLTNEAGAAIKQYNMDLEEGVAILATYADQGVKGQVAGSMMARLMRLLIRSINDNRGAFKKLNVDVDEFAATGKNVTGVIADITKAVAGMGPAQKAATLETLGFEARVQQAILPLLGAEEAIRKYDKALRAAGGTTERVANKQMESFISQLKIAWNNVKGISYDIGKVLAPYVQEMGRWVREAAEYWRSLNDETKKYVGLAIGLTALMGPLAIAIGTVTSAAGGLVLMFALLNASIIATGGVALSVGMLTTKMLFLAWTITTVIAAIVLVPAAVWAVVDAFTEADLGFLSFVGGIRVGGYKISTYMTALAASILIRWEEFKLGMATIWDNIKFTLLEAGLAILKTWENLKFGIMSTAADAFWGVAGIWVDVMSAMESGLTRFISFAETQFSKVEGLFDTIAAHIVGAIEGVDPKDIIAGLDANRIAEQAGREQRKAARLAEIEQARLGAHKGLKASQSEEAGTRAQAFLDRQAAIKASAPDLKALYKRTEDRARRAQERIDRLQKVLLKAFVDDQDELDKAKKKKKAGEPSPPPSPGIPTPPNIGLPKHERQIVDFKQVALNRLSVKGLAGTRGEKKQKVFAPGVEDRLDTLIETVKGNRALAMAE